MDRKYTKVDLDRWDFVSPSYADFHKYEPDGGKTPMPLTMNIHHAVADGFHLSRFFLEVQEQIDSLV